MSRLNNEGVTRASSGILGALKEAENLKVNKVVLSNGAKAVETRKLTESTEICPKCHKEQCVCKEGEEYTGVKVADVDVTKETPVAQVMDDTDTPFDIYQIDGKYVDGNGVEVEDEMLIKAGLKESEEVPEGAEQDVPGEGKEPLQEETANWSVLAYMGNKVGFVKGGADGKYEISPKVDEATTFSSEEEAAEASKDMNIYFDGKARLIPTAIDLYEEDKPEEISEECEEKMVEGLQIVNIKGNTVLLKESKGFIVGKDYDKSTGIIKEAEEYRTEKFAKKAFERLANK